MRRHTVDVGGRTVGYRCAGRGSAVLVIGSIAHSGRSVVPLMEVLAEQHAVYAFDPPGYGASDPLVPGSGVEVIAGALSAALAALDVTPGIVVGVHSGGLVAIEWARSASRRPVVILDDTPILDGASRARCAARYAPPLPIVADGSHVLRHWAMVKAEHVWFPWYDQTPEAALSLDVTDVQSLHDAVLDRVKAGEQYASAYDAMWRYDPFPALSDVEVVALQPSTSRIGAPAGDLLPAGADPAVRRAVVARQVERHAARQLVGAMPDGSGPAPAPESAVPSVSPRDRGRWIRVVADTEWGQIAAHSFTPIAPMVDRPLVILHASPLAGSSMMPLAAGFTAQRGVLVLDTPGNGDSDGIGVDDPELHHFAAAMLAGLTDLGVDEFDVYGTHTGAMIGLELAIAAPHRVRNLAMNGVPVFTAAESVAAQAKYLLDLTPRWDGTHLLAAWSNVVDVLTWYPWHDRDPAHRRVMAIPDAAALHTRFVQMISGGTTYPVVHRAVLRHPTGDRLPLVGVRTLIGCAPGDPLLEFLDQAAATVPGAQAGVFSGHPAADAVILRYFFDGGDIA